MISIPHQIVIRRNTLALLLFFRKPPLQPPPSLFFLWILSRDAIPQTRGEKRRKNPYFLSSLLGWAIRGREEAQKDNLLLSSGGN